MRGAILACLILVLFLAAGGHAARAEAPVPDVPEAPGGTTLPAPATGASAASLADPATPEASGPPAAEPQDGAALSVEGPPDGQSAAAGPAAPRALYLDVSVNGAPTGLVAAFEERSGILVTTAEELTSVGILPDPAARLPDGGIRLDRLPGVTFGYDESAQRIDFTASDAERAAAIIDTEGSHSILDASPQDAPILASGFGALLNYSLYAATPDETFDRFARFGGVSGSFEGRLFSPYGVFSQTFVASAEPDGVTPAKRLDTSWAFSDAPGLRTYRAGDLVTGGLDWTRPTRLAGLQIQRNFALRSDLVTLPIPAVSGSAAVPSTVDVYLNGTKRFSQSVAAGPFDLVNLPVVTGAGTARVVVRDASGQEKVSESSFFASNKLLAPGLFDYSAEIGFGRQAFGTDRDRYDLRPMGSASLRYGLAPWLTAEAHAEGGADLANGGLGAVVSVGSIGAVSLSAAGSRTAEGETGLQFGASAEVELGEVTLRGRVQRSFDSYQDIASIIDAAATSEDGLVPRSSGPPRAVDQVSLSLPLVFDPSSVNLSFTRLESFEGEEKSVIGLSYSRAIAKSATVYVSGFKEVSGDGFGIHAGLSIPIGRDYASSLSTSSNAKGTGFDATLSKRGGEDVGDYSWQIRDSEGETSRRSALGAYRAPFAEFGAGLAQSGDRFRATAQMDGALVAAGGGIYASTPIEDAFAIVDVGVPGVAVEHENRVVGRTDAKGTLLLPRLRALEENRISIDPRDLPLDTTLDKTREIVIPADRSGVVVAFDAGESGTAALVTFRDEAGDYLPLGSLGRVSGTGEPFVVGYDGQAYVEGLTATNRIVMEPPGGGSCVATFSHASAGGAQVAIPDVVCRAGG